jgi:hypothetical protein
VKVSVVELDILERITESSSAETIRVMLKQYDMEVKRRAKKTAEESDLFGASTAPAPQSTTGGFGWGNSLGSGFSTNRFGGQSNLSVSTQSTGATSGFAPPTTPAAGQRGPFSYK